MTTGGDKRSKKRTLKSKEQIVKTRIKDDMMNKIRNKSAKKKGSSRPNTNSKSRFRPSNSHGKKGRKK